MRHGRRRPTLLLLTLLVGGLLLSGCGQKGGLYLPDHGGEREQQSG